MSIQATRLTSKLKTTLAAALTLAAASAMAQVPRSPLVGVYLGATAGVGAAQWECKTDCNRASFSGKGFVGYRMTPGLAAEVNQMYFGGMDRTDDANNIANERMVTRATSVGINWEVQLLHHFVNSLRIGWAFTNRNSAMQYADGSTGSKKDRSSALYLGAGLAFRVNETTRLLSSADYIVDGHNSLYLFSIGAQTEF
jgi:hypothetical protein